MAIWRTSNWTKAIWNGRLSCIVKRCDCNRPIPGCMGNWNRLVQGWTIGGKPSRNSTPWPSTRHPSWLSPMRIWVRRYSRPSGGGVSGKWGGVREFEAPDAIRVCATIWGGFGTKWPADQAIFQLREVIRLFPSDMDAHVDLGLALEEKGRLDEAVTEYRLAVALEPGNALAHFNEQYVNC